MSATPPVRTLIVDDEPLARRRLRTILADEAGIEIIGEASTGRAAVTAIVETRPDLLLLDIQMPGQDGFAVLRQIAGVHQPVVVFIAAHDKHAIRAFEMQAIDYVLKPVIEDRLRAAVRRAIQRVGERRHADLTGAIARLLESVDRGRTAGRIAVKTERGVALLPVGDIHWVEAEGDYVRFHTAKGAHLLRATLSEIESRLEAPRFARVHRSAIVNVESIREIQPLFKGDYVLVLKTGAEVRSGRSHRATVQALMRTLA